MRNSSSISTKARLLFSFLIIAVFSILAAGSFDDEGDGIKQEREENEFEKQDTVIVSGQSTPESEPDFEFEQAGMEFEEEQEPTFF